MNLVWNRNTATKEPQNSSFSCDLDLKDLHWAEMILNQLNQPEELASAIRDAFPSIKFQDGFDIVDIHHIPGRSLKIITEFQNSKSNNDFTIIHIIFYSELECQEQYACAIEQAIDTNRVGFVKKWNAIALIFPEDSNLPNLSEMLNINKIGAYLNETDTSGASWKMLSYKAGLRCAFSYHFPQSGKNYFGKIQADDRTENNHNCLIQLWESPTRRFDMAQPIVHEPALKARWETFVVGKSIETTLQETELSSIVNLIITNIANLHEQNIPSLPTVTPKKLIEKIQRRVLRRIQSRIPSMAARTENILNELVHQIHYANDNQSVTLHGDFHIANLLIKENNLFFIDLDSMCKGSPCYDLALFGSRLMLRNLLNNDRLAETLPLIADLPYLYTSISGVQINRNTYAWYMSAFMIARQVKCCMSNAAPNMEFLVSKLLDWSEDCLNSIELPTLNLR